MHQRLFGIFDLSLHSWWVYPSICWWNEGKCLVHFCLIKLSMLIFTSFFPNIRLPETQKGFKMKCIEWGNYTNISHTYIFKAPPPSTFSSSYFLPVSGHGNHKRYCSQLILERQTTKGKNWRNRNQSWT